MFELIDTVPSNAVIKVIGVGGGGGNAVKHMIENNVEGVDFICANTDAQALIQSSAKQRVQLGQKLTRGLGAGGNPAIGQKAAEESRADLAQTLQGADLVSMVNGDFSTRSVMQAAKQLTRRVIDFYLGGKQLHSRELYRQHLMTASVEQNNNQYDQGQS